MESCVQIAWATGRRDEAAMAVAERIRARHNYALPEVTVMPISDGPAAPLEWAAVSVDC